MGSLPCGSRGEWRGENLGNPTLCFNPAHKALVSVSGSRHRSQAHWGVPDPASAQLSSPLSFLNGTSVIKIDSHIHATIPQKLQPCAWQSQLFKKYFKKPLKGQPRETFPFKSCSNALQASPTAPCSQEGTTAQQSQSRE